MGLLDKAKDAAGDAVGKATRAAGPAIDKTKDVAGEVIVKAVGAAGPAYEKTKAATQTAGHLVAGTVAELKGKVFPDKPSD